jgi:hypothetical protein
MNRNFSYHRATPAAVSWWLGAKRECMLQTAREQQDRMSTGAAASFVSALTRRDSEPPRKRKADGSTVSKGRAVLAMAGHEASEDRIEESRPPSALAVRL